MRAWCFGRHILISIKYVIINTGQCMVRDGVRSGLWSSIHVGGDLGSHASVHHTCHSGSSSGNDSGGSGGHVCEVGLSRAVGHCGVMVHLAAVRRCALRCNAGRHQTLRARGRFPCSPAAIGLHPLPAAHVEITTLEQDGASCMTSPVQHQARLNPWQWLFAVHVKCLSRETTPREAWLAKFLLASGSQGRQGHVHFPLQRDLLFAY